MAHNQLKKEVGWRKSILCFRNRFGKEFLNIYLKFLVEDALKEGLVIPDDRVAEYRTAMCLFIASKLQNHTSILAKSRFASWFKGEGSMGIYEIALINEQFSRPLRTNKYYKKRIEQKCRSTLLALVDEKSINNMLSFAHQSLPSDQFCV